MLENLCDGFCSINSYSLFHLRNPLKNWYLQPVSNARCVPRVVFAVFRRDTNWNEDILSRPPQRCLFVDFCMVHETRLCGASFKSANHTFNELNGRLRPSVTKNDFLRHRQMMKNNIGEMNMTRNIVNDVIPSKFDTHRAEQDGDGGKVLN